MRILIAEDDQVLADGLLRSLRNSGAAVDHVASGTEADAALLTNTEFDLLILDLGLPKLHGLEVLKKLRARGQTLPVLILTAADGVDERVKGLDYGADDYMAKPFALSELEARVRALTRRGMGAATSTIKHGPLESQVLYCSPSGSSSNRTWACRCRSTRAKRSAYSGPTVVLLTISASDPARARSNASGWSNKPGPIRMG